MGNILFPLSFLFGGDKRSYLYPGKNKNQLTPQEAQLEQLYDKIDRPGNRITPQQFFQTPEAAQLLDQLHGALTDRLPPGSQIVQQTTSKITYRDKDGYEHTITRKPDGTVLTLTDRPAVLPNKEQQELAQRLEGSLQQSIGQPPAFAQLDPQMLALLQSINAAEVGANDKELADLQGQLVAQLYGKGVNQSSVAQEAAGRFTEGAGRVRQQQRSDAANRELALRNLLTTLGQQNKEFEGSLYSNITGQGTQRDIASAGLGLDREKLVESGRQFNANNVLDTLRLQLERDAFDRAGDPISQLSRLIGLGQQGASAASGGIAAYRALTGGR